MLLASRGGVRHTVKYSAMHRTVPRIKNYQAKGRHINGHHIYKKVFNITNQQGNAGRIHNELSTHNC